MKKKIICGLLGLSLLLTCSCKTNIQPSQEETPPPTEIVTPTLAPEPTPIVTPTPEPPEVVTPSPVESPAASEVPSTTIPTPSARPTSTPAVPTPSPEPTPTPTPEPPAMDIAEELPALIDTPAIPIDYTPTAPGIETKVCDKAIIDFSNAKDGYVMVKWTATTEKRLKTQVVGPTTTYTYNLTPYDYTAFALSDGNGKYQIKVYENTTGTKYATVLSVTFSVSFDNEFTPFLKSNQYVNFANATTTKAKAKEICEKAGTSLDKVSTVYNWVVTNLSYDKELAQNVQSGYLPDLDSVLAKRKGICFDYAALMSGMLRSQGVPCKLVVGYAGTAYHAWISVYTEENGWIEGAIYFDGKTWKRMDPTFASTGNQSDAILQYIGDGKNYTAKYFY